MLCGRLEAHCDELLGCFDASTRLHRSNCTLSTMIPTKIPVQHVAVWLPCCCVVAVQTLTHFAACLLCILGASRLMTSRISCRTAASVVPVCMEAGNGKIGKIGKIERSGLKWRNPKPRGRVLTAYCVEVLSGFWIFVARTMKPLCSCPLCVCREA